MFAATSQHEQVRHTTQERKYVATEQEGVGRFTTTI